MKLGFGLYYHQLTDENFRFARQCGATHLTVHLVDYFHGNKKKDNQPVGNKQGWGIAGNTLRMWETESLIKLKKRVEKHGLELFAIENFDPAQWYDVLQAGPKREEQLEELKRIIRNAGKAGISTIGYNFSIAGVYGRRENNAARGNAVSVGVHKNKEHDTPIPKGTIWNMIYDIDAEQGNLESLSHDELWERLKIFLDAVLPVAEESGVTLAAHPDDPPFATLRQTPRLIYQPHMFKRLLELHPSSSNKLEFCLGTIAEMTEGDIYEATAEYASTNSIAYIHCRNVRGKIPFYDEVFIDEGDIDIVRIFKILKKHDFQGVVVPDHTPLMSCPAPWHTGMAFTMGYLNAVLNATSLNTNV
jgi:mannonate dehydratase